MRMGTLQDVADALKRSDRLDTCAEALGDALHVQLWIVEVHADELRRLDARSHCVAPEILEQSVFMVHKADEDGRNSVFCRRPECVDREGTAAIAEPRPPPRGEK